MGISTVSRALHDSHEISTKTKEKVMAYARKVKYIPNPIALSLRDKRNKSIGIVISQFNNPFCSQVIHGMESVACARGYQVSIVQTNESAQREKDAIAYLCSRVDGLLVSISSETRDITHLQELHEKGMPMVFYDRVCQHIETHITISDNYKGAYDATLHLLEEGFKRIAFIGGASTQPIVRERKRGYLNALREGGIKPQNPYIKYCPMGGLHFGETEAVMNELMDMPIDERPDALLTCWDKVTIDAYRYLRSHDYRMPDDMAMIGFSNFPLTDYVSPSLSVIQQQTEKLGEVAALQLIELLENKHKPFEYRTEVLKPDLIIRETSRRHS